VFDELELLRENADLQRLLGHYAECGEADREAWQDRLMGLEGVEAADLVKLHGLLIAFGWVDQNTGATPAGQPGTVPGCYRVTAAGLRARKIAKAAPGELEVVETLAAGTDEAAEPKRREWKKGKSARPKKAAVEQAEVMEIPAEEAVPVLA
jgi:hypothetical protein